MSGGEIKIPLQTPILFIDTSDSIADEAETLSKTFQETVETIIANVLKEDATFENVVKKFIEMENNHILQSRRIKFYGSTNPDQKIRDASFVATKLLDDKLIDFYTNDNFFQLVEEIWRKTGGSKELGEEDAHYLFRMRQDFLRNGAALQDQQKKIRLIEVRKRLQNLSTEAGKNMHSNNSGLWLTRDELDGLQDSFIARLPTKDDDGQKYWIRMKDPDTRPVLLRAIDPKVRRRVYESNKCRVPENVPLYTEMFALRREAAQLMGFKNHAEYRIHYKMVGNADYVNKTLKSIENQARSKRDRELAELLQVKNEDLLAQNLPEESRLYEWDQSYYYGLKRDTKHEVQVNSVEEYFPLEHCLGEMFKIYEKIFGVRYVEVERQADYVWHESVKMFSLWDTDDNNQFLGYLYLDVFPRESKYSHSGHYALAPGFVYPSGERHFPCSALILNFPQPSKTKPCLLSQNDVRKLFHELGHGSHNLLSKVTYARFHGTKVDTDFVEVPSVMFEHFMWDPTIRTSISCHYAHLSEDWMRKWQLENSGNEPPPKKLPEEVNTRLVQAKNRHSASQGLGQVFLSAFDMAVHSQEDRDLTADEIMALHDDMRYEITGFAGTKAITGTPSSGFSSFRSLAGSNYDAGYYTYVLAKVFSTDLFYTGFKGNMLDEERGRKYRYTVLKPGGSRPEWKTLTDFLGREPNANAYNQENGWVN